MYMCVCVFFVKKMTVKSIKKNKISHLPQKLQFQSSIGLYRQCLLDIVY